MVEMNVTENTVVINGTTYKQDDNGVFVAVQKKKKNAVFREGEVLSITEVANRLTLFSDPDDYMVSVVDIDGVPCIDLDCTIDRTQRKANGRIVFLSLDKQMSN